MSATVIDLRSGEVLEPGERPAELELRYTMKQAMELLHAALATPPEHRQRALQNCINRDCLTVEAAAALWQSCADIEKVVEDTAARAAAGGSHGDAA